MKYFSPSYLLKTAFVTFAATHIALGKAIENLNTTKSTELTYEYDPRFDVRNLIPGFSTNSSDKGEILEEVIESYYMHQYEELIKNLNEQDQDNSTEIINDEWIERQNLGLAENLDQDNQEEWNIDISGLDDNDISDEVDEIESSEDLEDEYRLPKKTNIPTPTTKNFEKTSAEMNKNNKNIA